MATIAGCEDCVRGLCLQAFCAPSLAAFWTVDQRALRVLPGRFRDARRVDDLLFPLHPQGPEPSDLNRVEDAGRGGQSRISGCNQRF